jgi:hypothetical protein
MFYDSKPQGILRFGDIVRGFLLTHSNGYSPSSVSKPDAYHIEVVHPELAAVLTPCCTIAESSGNMLVITPLREIKPDYYFDNSYMREDYTRINREMTIQQAIGPDKWKEISDEEKSQRLADSPGKKYIAFYLFAYDRHDLLPEYELKYKKMKASINYYMIDFRNICRVQIPSDIDPLSIKILQLSIQARKELREKLSHYFGRRPEEDAL